MVSTFWRFVVCIAACGWLGGSCIAGAPEFQCEALWTSEPRVAPVTEVDEVNSPDGRFLIRRTKSSDGQNGLSVIRRKDGQELFQVIPVHTGTVPAFSKQGELLATMVVSRDHHHRYLTVHHVETGKKVFQQRLRYTSSYSPIVAVTEEFVMTVGERNIPGFIGSCRILSLRDASLVAELFIPPESLELQGVNFAFQQLELTDSHLTLSTNYDLGKREVFDLPRGVTYRWEWKKIRELAKEGQSIVPAGNKLDLVVRVNSLPASPLDTLKKLGGTVSPFQLEVSAEENEVGRRYSGTSKNVDDPEGGVAIGLTETALSDQEIIGLLRQIPRVKKIYFSGDQFVDLGVLTQLPDLEKVGTSRLWTDNDFNNLAKCKSLKTLPSFVSRNGPLQQISQMPSLQEVVLYTENFKQPTSSDISDAGVAHLAKSHSLRKVRIGSGQVTVEGLMSIAAIPNLSHLEIDVCPQFDDDALKALAGAKKLRHLVLGNGNRSRIRFTDAGMVHLAGVSSLESLNLNYLPITDKGIHSIVDLKNLQELNLSGTSVSDAALAELVKLPSLASLELNSCKNVSDEGLLHLQHVGSLKMLSLTYSSSRITKDGVKKLRSLRPDLRIWTGGEG